jgi:acyl transferase domain-containing protein
MDTFSPLQIFPEKYAQFLEGQEAAKMYLRAADCSPHVSFMEVLFDGEGQMYLNKGWEKFACAHSVKIGSFLHFKYEVDDELTVKVFDGTMCRRYYHTDSDESNEESDVKPCI